MPTKATGKAAKAAPAIPEISTPVLKVPSAADMLGALAGGKVKGKKAAKPDRPEVALSEYAQELFADLAPATELADIFKSHAENVKGQFNAEVFAEYTKTMFANGSQPTNPALKVRDENGKIDCEGIMIVQEKIKIQIPDTDDPIESTIALLVKSGVSQTVARKIIENEVDFTPTISLRPFTELMNGHYEERQMIEATAAEKAVAAKLLAFVTQELSEEERELVIRNDAGTVVKQGFLQRVATYAATEKELIGIFKVMTPVYYPKGVKFAVADTPVNRTNRLIEKASAILGTSEE
jgi:hypothetical protein